mmetsp:Transcript_1809/g.2699  ORF Transcript_1809/g.2699 Transcript_1809/m.2699 type:complete len:81 (+) Transcript_1809:94-336(+)
MLFGAFFFTALSTTTQHAVFSFRCYLFGSEYGIHEGHLKKKRLQKTLACICSFILSSFLCLVLPLPLLHCWKHHQSPATG